MASSSAIILSPAPPMISRGAHEKDSIALYFAEFLCDGKPVDTHSLIKLKKIAVPQAEAAAGDDTSGT